MKWKRARGVSYSKVEKSKQNKNGYFPSGNEPNEFDNDESNEFDDDYDDDDMDDDDEEFDERNESGIEITPNNNMNPFNQEIKQEIKS